MDELNHALSKWEKMSDDLREIEDKYFNLDGSDKPFFAELFLQAEGKSVSEREYKAYASKEYQAFQKGLAHAHSEYNHSRRAFDIQAKRVDVLYLERKLQSDQVKRWQG